MTLRPHATGDAHAVSLLIVSRKLALPRNLFVCVRARRAPRKVDAIATMATKHGASLGPSQELAGAPPSAEQARPIGPRKRPTATATMCYALLACHHHHGATLA